MAELTFSNIGITGIVACVPHHVHFNKDLSSLIPSSEELEKVINTIGIQERRIADQNTCASDLCFQAADALLTQRNIDRQEIDVLIFMTQTPDYLIPAGAPHLQHRLGLPASTACFDVSLACSGYVYSLCTAFAYASQPHIRKVLLLDGETFSKIVSPKDKVNAPLYGDCGTATLVEKGDFGQSSFLLFSDGSGQDSLKIPAGGFRKPSSADTVVVAEREEGNFRSDHHVYMNGMDIFNFTMKVVPNSIKELLNVTGSTFDEIDYVVFHQANKFMTDFFAKKLKLPESKIPYCLDQYGNTSSASIPLTFASRLAGFADDMKKQVVLSGFGAGLSWGAALLTFYDTHLSLIEYQSE